jgi:hypothetical protein
MNSGFHAHLLIKNSVNVVKNFSQMQRRLHHHYVQRAWQILKYDDVHHKLSGGEATFISCTSVVYM